MRNSRLFCPLYSVFALIGSHFYRDRQVRKYRSAIAHPFEGKRWDTPWHPRADRSAQHHFKENWANRINKPWETPRFPSVGGSSRGDFVGYSRQLPMGFRSRDTAEKRQRPPRPTYLPSLSRWAQSLSTYETPRYRSKID